MNILIPHNWLLEHLETEATPQKLQELLSLSGPSVERVEEKENEPVYDIEVTTNRVDSMSVRGIAREAGVILSQAGVPAKLKPLQIPAIPNSNNKTLPLPKIENDPTLCKRITCVVLSTVDHSATPDWMAKRLKQIDQNVHYAAIDITNYITHELGHPCHAFDYNKIMALGGVISVVEAEAGKPFKTLDGVEYKTVGGEVVFENEHGEIIDLPAIKGTHNTAVDDNTQNILFWIESINHQKVRHGSMSHAIRTVAAQLNEKQVDPNLADSILARGVELYQSLCHATVASEVYNEFPGKADMKSVKTPASTFSRYLGIELQPETITSLLEQLECRVSYDSASQTFDVTPPTFRPDIEIPADVVEEIARIYGYHNLPSRLMDTAIPTVKPTNTNFDFEHATKTFLAHIGWQELYTYSLVSESVASDSGFSPAQHMKLQNPLTDDRVYLRRSLVPSLQEILNMNSQVKSLSVFELANVYHPQNEGLPTEELHLTLVGQKTYQAVRADLEALLRQFYITTISIVETTNNSEQKGDILLDEKAKIGTVTILANNRVAVDLLVSAVLPYLKTHPTYQPLPKAAAVTEDLTFVLPPKTAIGSILSTIRKTSTLVSAVELADQYKQNFTFTITYLDKERSLSSTEVEPIRKKIVEVVTQEYNGALVGSVS